MPVLSPRRTLLKLAGACLLATGFATAAQAEETHLRVSTIPIIDTAPLQVAIAKGYFKNEGLDVDTTPTAGGAAGLPALAAGQVQIAFSNIVSIVLGAKQGLPFEVIAMGEGTGAEPPDLAGLVAKNGSAVKTGKDLEGKRLAVNTRNNIIWLYAREWVRATGGDPDKVTYLEVPFPQMADAVRGGRVDAAFLVEPFLSASTAKSGGLHLVGWPYNQVQKNIPVGMYASTKDYIQQHPDVITKFVRAYNKAVDWSNANIHSDEFVKIVSGYTKLPPEKIKGLNLTPYPKTVDPAGIEGVVKLMEKNGMMKGPVDVKGLLYKTALQGAQ